MEDGKAETMSAAEQRVRDATAAIVERVANGSKPRAALAMSGYGRGQANDVLTIGAGGQPHVTDEGYRAACTELVEQITVAAATVDHALAERWREIAVDGGDWRAIAELLKRRDPDEWAVTERSEVELAGGVEIRGEDAILAALADLRGESPDDAAA
jgi:hypothetical protein